MKRSYLLYLAAATIIIFGGAWWIAPYVAVSGLKDALASGDVAVVQDYVDIDRIRPSLARQAKASMIKKMREEVDTSNGFAMLGASIGMSMIDSAIDTSLTPEAISGLLVQSSGISSSDEWSIDRQGLGQFRLVSKVDGPVEHVQFERSGFGWKVVGMQMSNTFLDEGFASPPPADQP